MARDSICRTRLAARMAVSRLTTLWSLAGFCLVLVALGALREILGSGTVFSGFSMLLGPGADRLAIELPFEGMLVAVLPPGAFFGLAVLLAVRNVLNAREERQQTRTETTTTEDVGA